MTHCSLYERIHNGKVFMSISEGIRGLKEVVGLANQQLQQYLDPYGHTPSKYTSGLLKHDTTKTMLNLVVNDFRVKHIIKSNAKHLIQALKDKHEDKEVNWEGSKLCGIDLKWD